MPTTPEAYENSVLTALSELDGRPVVIVGVPSGALKDGFGVARIELDQFPGVDLRRAQLLVVLAPTQSTIIQQLAPLIGPNTQMTQGGQPLPKA